MVTEGKCPLCQVRERAKGLVSEPETEALRSCAAAAPVLIMLPARIGFRLFATGAFLFADELCKAKSFIDSECGPAGGPGAARKEG